MRHFSPRLGFFVAPAFVGLAIFVSACNSSTTTSTPVPVPTASGRGAASCVAGSAAQTATVTIQNGTVTTPSVGGCSATLTFTAVSAPTTATVTTQLTPPANYPVPSPAPSGFSGAGTVVFYTTIKPTASVTLGATPTLAFTVQSATAGNNFFNAFGDTGPSQIGAQGFGNAGIVSGNTITFTPSGGSGGGASLTGGDTYVLSLVYF